MEGGIYSAVYVRKSDRQLREISGYNVMFIASLNFEAICYVAHKASWTLLFYDPDDSNTEISHFNYWGFMGQYLVVNFNK